MQYHHYNNVPLRRPILLNQRPLTQLLTYTVHVSKPNTQRCNSRQHFCYGLQWWGDLTACYVLVPRQLFADRFASSCGFVLTFLPRVETRCGRNAFFRVSFLFLLMYFCFIYLPWRTPALEHARQVYRCLSNETGRVISTCYHYVLLFINYFKYFFHVPRRVSKRSFGTFFLIKLYMHIYSLASFLSLSHYLSVHMLYIIYWWI